MKYSFIVPVYGCEDHLETCVGSLLAQRGNHDFEIILVDDGARDRSGRIADELAAKHSRIRTFHKENGGAASARNYGIREAAGEYLLFIDGDDTVEPELLNQASAHQVNAPGTMILYGLAFDYYRGSQLVRTDNLSCRHKGIFTVAELFADYRSFFLDNALSSACNKVFSAKIIQEQGLRFREGMTLYEDYDYVLRYLAHIDMVICIDQPLYHYRNDLNQAHLNQRVGDVEKLRQNMALLMDSVQQMDGIRGQVCDTTANLYLQLLSHHLMAANHSLTDMKKLLLTYCMEPGFIRLLDAGAKLGPVEQQLLDWIQNEEFLCIRLHFFGRKCQSHLKRAIKKGLRVLGVKKYL